MTRAFATDARLQLLLVIAVAGLALLRPALGGADGAPADRLLVLSPPNGDETGHRGLLNALEAHLTGAGIAVASHPVAAIPDERQAQERLARGLLGAARAVLWVDVPRRLVLLISRDSNRNECQLERRFDCVDGELHECADAIAAVVSSAIFTWRETADPAPEQKLVPEVFAADNELSPVELAHRPWHPPDPLARLALAVGYGAAFFAGTSRAVHGLALGAEAILIRHLLVELLANVYWPLDGDSAVNGGWIEIRRWDLLWHVGGVLPLGRWSIAAAIGMAHDFSARTELADGMEAVESDDARSGVSAALETRVALDAHFTLFAAVGLDAFRSDLVYRASDASGTTATLIRFGSIQGRAVIGAAFGFGIGRMSEAR